MTISDQAISSINKSLDININDLIYGTFVEIGAGQEVARHFFRAGAAAGTIAKTMSAYDMVFSDSIYGREEKGRYVSKARLQKMLEREYDLLDERLSKVRGDKSTFFAFANTVSARNYQGTNRCHGWLGIRFQLEPMQKPNDLILHVCMHDDTNTAQQEAIGILGVNLIYGVFNYIDKPQFLISSLMDNISRHRIEIDMVSFNGPSVTHIDDRLMCLQLVQEGFTDAVLFDSDGSAALAADTLYKKPIFIQRGSYRPVTKLHVDIQDRGVQQFKKEAEMKGEEPEVLMEITMHQLREEGKLDHQNFLDRVDTLTVLGYKVLVSNFFLFYKVKNYLERYTKKPIGMVVGAILLEKMFYSKYYEDLKGGILEGFGRLVHGNAKIYVFPFRSEKETINVGLFEPTENLRGLYKQLIDANKIVDISDCENVDVSIRSLDVVSLIRKGDSAWEKLVPEQTVTVIKEKKLFQKSSKS